MFHKNCFAILCCWSHLHLSRIEQKCLTAIVITEKKQKQNKNKTKQNKKKTKKGFHQCFFWYDTNYTIYEAVLQIGEAGFTMFVTMCARTWCNQSMITTKIFKKWVFVAHAPYSLKNEQKKTKAGSLISSLNCHYN